MGDGKAYTLGKKSKCQQGSQMGEELPKELIPAKRVWGAESGIAREGVSGTECRSGPDRGSTSENGVSRESAGGSREKTRSGESEAGTSSRSPQHRT